MCMYIANFRCMTSDSVMDVDANDIGMATPMYVLHINMHVYLFKHEEQPGATSMHMHSNSESKY